MSTSKHQRNSAATRDKLIDAAVELFSQRGIAAVSLREIGARAGQKNPNALQYHFKNRTGLLQAIVDRHASQIQPMREAYLQDLAQAEQDAARAAAQGLVVPVVRYIERDTGGAGFVQVMSQISAFYQSGVQDSASSANDLSFPPSPALRSVLLEALAHLPAREAQRRVYLAVNSTFHGLADIYREAPAQRATAVRAKKPMVEQLICMLQAFFSAPSQRD